MMDLHRDESYKLQTKNGTEIEAKSEILTSLFE